MLAREIHSFCEETMSKKTMTQMEADLMDKIKKAHVKLDALQQQYKLELGNLAYKHGLQHVDIKQLDLAFVNIASEKNHGHG